MIPIYKPYLNKNILKYAHDALDSGWISSNGYYLDAAKEKLKSFLGVKWVILTNNGTTATHLLSKTLSFKNKNINEIYCPNNVYVAAWNSFLYDKNIKLLPIDANLDTWNMDFNKITDIKDNQAILIVHNLGNIVNVPELKNKYKNTIFLEDNCEGFLGKYDNKYSGTESLASSISFFGNKTITSGEGGAFITNDDDVFEYINCIKNQGQSSIKFIHDHLGYNYRMTNLQAAILYGQLKYIDEIVDKKQFIFNEYRKKFIDFENITLQKIEDNTNPSNWIFAIRLNNFDVQRKKELELFLFNNDIETRPMFYDINKHEHLKNVICDNTNAEKLNSQIIMLPSYPELTTNQINYVVNNIKKFITKNK